MSDTASVTPSATVPPVVTIPPTATATATRHQTNADLNGTDCNIYDAITAANTNTATGACPAGRADDHADGHDVITLNQDITLDAVLPEITSDLTIDGTASEYDIDGGANTDSWEFSTGGLLIFRSSGSGTDLTLKNLDLRNARQSGSAVQLIAAAPSIIRAGR